MEQHSTKFNPNDEVMLIDNGKVYSSYEEMYKLLGARTNYCTVPIRNNTVGKIVAVHSQEQAFGGYIEYYLFESNSGVQVVVGENGLALIKSQQTKFKPGDGVPMWNISHEDIIKESNYIKYKDMNIIDKIRVNIKGEPMKTLIKNEILTLDERLTTTGKELFNDFLYAKFKDEFIADLAPKLEGLNDKE